MFTIKDVDFRTDDYGVEPYLNNWPMLYILKINIFYSKHIDS